MRPGTGGGFNPLTGIRPIPTGLERRPLQTGGQSSFNPLTGIRPIPTTGIPIYDMASTGMFQSPDGDSSNSHGPHTIQTGGKMDDVEGFNPLTGIRPIPTWCPVLAMCRLRSMVSIP